MATGHIENKNNKFIVVIEYGVDEHGKRIRKYKTFEKEKEAKNYLIKMLSQSPYNKMRLGIFLTKWMDEYVKQYVAPATYLRYYDALKHVYRAFENTPIDEINAYHLQIFFNSLQEKLSHASIQKIFSILNNAFKTAIKWELIKNNPLSTVKLPNNFEKTNIKVWDMETIKRFTEEMQDEKIYVPVMIALHAGLRAGEICGLTWDNINFDNRIIYIKQALQKLGKEIIIKQPKTRTSIRTIYMTDTLYNVLLNEYKRQEPYREEYIAMGNFVCVHEMGTPMTPDYLTHAFKKLLKRYDYPIIRFHDLRHTFATILLQADIDPKTAAEILGHADTKMFLNRYAHVLEEQKKKATEKINTFFNSL